MLSSIRTPNFNIGKYQRLINLHGFLASSQPGLIAIVLSFYLFAKRILDKRSTWITLFRDGNGPIFRNHHRRCAARAISEFIIGDKHGWKYSFFFQPNAGIWQLVILRSTVVKQDVGQRSRMQTFFVDLGCQVRFSQLDFGPTGVEKVILSP